MRRRCLAPAMMLVLTIDGGVPGTLTGRALGECSLPSNASFQPATFVQYLKSPAELSFTGHSLRYLAAASGGTREISISRSSCTASTRPSASRSPPPATTLRAISVQSRQAVFEFVEVARGIVERTVVGEQQPRQARGGASKRQARAPVLDLDIGWRHGRQNMGRPGKANASHVTGGHRISDLPCDVVDRVPGSVVGDDFEPPHVDRLTVFDRAKPVLGNAFGDAPQRHHHVLVDPLGRREKLVAGVRQVGSTRRV